MKKISVITFAIIIFQTVYAQNKLQQIMNTYKDSLKSYGVVALVGVNDKIETGQIGFSYPGHPINSNQLFAIGSITKNFIAVTVLKLQEQKLINIDDHIGKYIELNNKFIDTSISIKQLLNHSSGLKEYSDPEFINRYLLNPKLVFSDKDIIGQIDTIGFVKGEKHEYCNTNYFLLGLIIEKIKDKPLSIVLDELIIKPYHLSNTYTYLSKDIPNFAHPIQNNHDLIDFLPFLTITNQGKGVGQMVSCAADLYSYFHLLFVEKKILSEKSLQVMLSFEQGDGEEYGLGIFRTKVDGKEFINHSGRTVSYISYLYFVPQDNLIAVVLTNNMDDTFARKIKNKIFLEFLK